MSTARINYTKIESNAFTNVFEMIDLRSNIRDPRDSTGNKIRTFVYDSDPFMTSFDFNLLPLIIVEMPMPEYSDKCVDGTKKMVTWKQKITILTSKRGASNFNDQLGRIDMLNICDDLHELFNSSSKKYDFRALGMNNMNLSKDSTNTLVIEGKDVYESSYNLTYDAYMKVTA